eukprot:536838-Prorocentrum_minimum.AAC.2
MIEYAKIRSCGRGRTIEYAKIRSCGHTSPQMNPRARWRRRAGGNGGRRRRAAGLTGIPADARSRAARAKRRRGTPPATSGRIASRPPRWPILNSVPSASRPARGTPPAQPTCTHVNHPINRPINHPTVILPGGPQEQPTC